MTEDKLQFACRLRREMTPQERKFWQVIRGRRLGGFKFRRQQVIDGFIADFYCPAVGLVLELDGAVHDRQGEYDVHRDRVIASRQIAVLRLANRRIEQEFEQVLSEIESPCRERETVPTAGNAPVTPPGEPPPDAG